MYCRRDPVKKNQPFVQKQIRRAKVESSGWIIDIGASHLSSYIDESHDNQNLLDRGSSMPRSAFIRGSCRDDDFHIRFRIITIATLNVLKVSTLQFNRSFSTGQLTRSE